MCKLSICLKITCESWLAGAAEIYEIELLNESGDQLSPAKTRRPNNLSKSCSTYIDEIELLNEIRDQPQLIRTHSPNSWP